MTNLNIHHAAISEVKLSLRPPTSTLGLVYLRQGSFLWRFRLSPLKSRGGHLIEMQSRLFVTPRFMGLNAFKVRMGKSDNFVTFTVAIFKGFPWLWVVLC